MNITKCLTKAFYIEHTRSLHFSEIICDDRILWMTSGAKLILIIATYPGNLL